MGNRNRNRKPMLPPRWAPRWSVKGRMRKEWEKSTNLPRAAPRLNCSRINKRIGSASGSRTETNDDPLDDCGLHRDGIGLQPFNLKTLSPSGITSGSINISIVTDCRRRLENAAKKLTLSGYDCKVRGQPGRIGICLCSDSHPELHITPYVGSGR
ncbi:AGAP010226-PA-like protein [Anopheles sinensis]|uniref:AGAP010226-PA-like protein n=1 Tax=Anopheles sinensis TaxID=74873 RepID=A0A084WTE4_ANOSI|nr:AGAP010226-PA-like protein [Anopheles sinensis]